MRVFLMHSWRVRRRSLVVLALMIGLTGGAVFAAFAGARRSSDALERFRDAGQTLDVFVAADVTGPEPPALLELLDGPVVESTNDLAFLFVDVDKVGVVFAPTSRRGLQIEQGVLVAGRRANPDAADEVTVTESTARNLGLQIGDLFEADSLSPEQASAFFENGAEPTSADGPSVRLHVVGIIRNGFDLNSLGEGETLTMTTPAFWEKYGEDIGIGSFSHMVRLVDQPDALQRFTDGVAAAYGSDHLPSINVGQGEATVANAISVITAALLAMGLVVAVAGLLWIGSATARHQRLASPDIDVLRALGTTSGERRNVLFGSVAPALVGGIVLAPMFAVALSPLFPVGLARRVDPDPGLHADGFVLLAGSVVLVVIIAVVAFVAALRLVTSDDRRASSLLRVSRLVDGSARLLRPAPGTGVRFALSAPPGSSASVRPALAGALVGVVGLVAVAIVGASLQRFVDAPSRWGTTWDSLVLTNYLASDESSLGPDAAPTVDREAVLANPDIDAAALMLYDEQITINGVEAISMTLDPIKGGLTPTLIQGREPRADDEIALARDTMDDVGVEMGGTVSVTSRSQATDEFRIVGVIVFPSVGNPTPIATGASLTAGGGERLLLGTGGADVGTPYVVVRWAHGVDRVAALIRLGVPMDQKGFDTKLVEPTPPPEVTGLLAAKGFPLFTGAALAVLGMIATSHALFMTVRRRRLDLGVLSALGFAPSQRRAVVLGQATTITAIALVVGIPVGALVGRVVWSAIAGSIGVAKDASFPILLLAVGAIGFVLVLNAIAALPARSASRLRVAEALRSE